MLSTWLCGYYGLTAEFPLTIIGIAIVFPVVFSIDSAYKRRERTLTHLAEFKGNADAVYLAADHWVENNDFKEEVKKHILEVYDALSTYCSCENDELAEKEKFLFHRLSNLSVKVQEFRTLDIVHSELSRINQYVSKISIAIENIKMIRSYRTPITLRAYSRVFIYSFPIIYGPYFEYAAEMYSHGLEYVMPIAFSFILVSLDNIQEHLENPFDQIGEDDVKFRIKEYDDYLS